MATNRTTVPASLRTSSGAGGLGGQAGSVAGTPRPQAGASRTQPARTSETPRPTTGGGRTTAAPSTAGGAANTPAKTPGRPCRCRHPRHDHADLAHAPRCTMSCSLSVPHPGLGFPVPEPAPALAANSFCPSDLTTSRPAAVHCCRCRPRACRENLPFAPDRASPATSSSTTSYVRP
jgi:hypothetical protein